MSRLPLVFLLLGLLLCVTRAEETPETENDSIPPPTRIEGETQQFQAQVSRLMELIINSLYSNSDIFLREVISNASDALDRIRHLSLSDPSVLQGSTAFEVRIRADNDTRKLYISDTGIGLTKPQLADYLGKIANSGTQQFMEAVKSNDMNAIGQFGVGFYSLFLVADLVTVHTKHPNGTHLVWQSDAKEGYVIADEQDQVYLDVVRGTTIELDLKEDADEFLKLDKLDELINRYSGFITFPIYLYDYEEVEVETPEKPDIEEKETEEELDIEETEEVEDEQEESKEKETELNWFWRHVNNQPAIWMRKPKEVSKEEYDTFYTSLTGDDESPLAHIHFKAEGEYEFRGLMFVPSRHVTNLIDEFEKSRLRLYVKRVFIGDEIPELLPRWLNFLRGIVDSDDLPLNVSREQLQKTRALRAIQNRLVKKLLICSRNWPKILLMNILNFMRISVDS
ncbi:hypothetical protein GEMRC1_012672 [Eukaryota sp. GEM-RC1]